MNENIDIKMIVRYLRLIENDLDYSLKDELIDLYYDLSMIRDNVIYILNDIDSKIKEIEKKEGK